ncbi:MAG: phosphonate C-P lyase system protein PhnG [Limimaricola sp.]|uniref:phosphonate C-P lyase system protein PhnG n=1 Tax=Limimaricola sp. TaxID=2211665 RepID=UPI001D65CE02|nr:phosphonate C-P lyase system protein PhnG [Limimaricola sp.]MBI1416449.1 phosphonate C-P lyase system protein PhnG [Limimaricola sp.]
MTSTAALTSEQEDRRAWLGLMASAPAGRLAALCTSAGLDWPADWLRPPEVGAVMVRGRAGGTGAPFNLGEMTVTRASVRLPSGEVGHGTVQGRDKVAAGWAAQVDALMQTGAADAVRAAVLAPLAAEADARRGARAAKAAATKVEFFTLVRGED